MKLDVMQAFANAARDVLAQEMGSPAEPQKMRLQGGPYRTQYVTVIIGLAQDIEGAVILGLTERTALQYVTNVMGEPVEVLDEVAQSGIGELANVIAGRAGVLLGEKGHQTLIAPPTIIMGEGTVLSTLGIPRLLIPVHTPLGEVELQLAAKEMR